MLACIAEPAQALDPNHRLTQYVHRIWQNQPGLPQASIYSLTQTQDGYIWVGTQSGVVRFDGVRFSPVPALEEASPGDDTWYRRIVEDGKHRVWLLGDERQIVRINNETAAKKLTVFSEAKYGCLFAAQGGSVWACTQGGLVKFDGDTVQSYPVPANLRPANSQMNLATGCQTSTGSVWMASGSSLYSWNGERYAKVALRSIPADALIRSVLCKENGLWIGSTRGLVRLYDGQETRFTVKDGLSDDLIITLTQGQGENFWVGTRNGFSRPVLTLKTAKEPIKSFENFGYNEGLSQNSVFSLLEDREGSLWVGTGNGLNQFFNGVATRYTKTEGLPIGNLGPVLADQRGNVWTGSPAGGLTQFDGHRFDPIPGTASLHYFALAAGKDGSLWAGTDAGVVRYVNGKQQATFTVSEGLPSNQVRTLLIDHDGNLWAGTDLGPAVLRGQRFEQAPALAGELRLPIFAMGETSAAGGTGDPEILFAAERNRVYTFSPKRGLNRLPDEDSFGPPLSEVNCFFTDPEGITWIGTNGAGLGMLRRGKLRKFYLRDGLVDAEIHGFVTDSHDRLWMAGSKGFVWVRRSDFFDLAAGKTDKVNSVPYRPVDGSRTMQGSTGVSPVATRAADGKLWFSSTVALLAFEPDAPERASELQPIIEEVSVNGAHYPADRVRSLGPGRENIAIDYTVLTFLAPGRLTFKYLLEGFDKDWTDAGTRRQAFYTNLPPGKFRFRVSACDPNGHCGEAGSGLALEVLPQVYQRAWFIPAIAGTLGLITLLVYRFRVQQLRSNFSLILAERNRIARELHDTLIQGFSGITMQLQALTSKVRSPEEKETLEEIIQDAGICLQETRRSVAGLRGATGASGNLATALTEAARHATEDRDVRLRLKLEDRQEALPAEIKYNLVCIAQEALANAAKHSSAGTIEMALSGNARELLLTIQDDGVGLQSSTAGPGHYGMVGMRERARHIGADFNVISPPGKGTTISVRLPFGKRAPTSAPQRSLERTS